MEIARYRRGQKGMRPLYQPNFCIPGPIHAHFHTDVWVELLRKPDIGPHVKTFPIVYMFYLHNRRAPWPKRLNQGDG